MKSRYQKEVCYSNVLRFWVMAQIKARNEVLTSMKQAVVVDSRRSVTGGRRRRRRRG
jgi:hypothetical protein